MARRHLDQYFTPRPATQALLAYHPSIQGDILECCAGTGNIADPLRAVGRVRTNDIDPALNTDWHWDATKPEFWDGGPTWDWVVSNPPFSCCQAIIVGAFSKARSGVAMLLRLSYLEPCNNRADFLAAHPPSLIVLPRISFTGDGKTDNVTCAWFVWDFKVQQSYVKIATKDDLRRFVTPAAAA